jgi:hypothetical protein
MTGGQLEKQHESSTSAVVVASNNNNNNPRKEMLVHLHNDDDHDDDDDVEDHDNNHPKRTQPVSQDDGKIDTTNKRSKGHNWLQFQGQRHTRVGDAYQVKSLPDPGFAQSELN